MPTNVDAHVPTSQTTEEHRNNHQMNQAARVFQIEVDWATKVNCSSLGEFVTLPVITEETLHADGLVTEG